MTARVATLGMYDHPAQQGANDRLWSVVAERLRSLGLDDVPDRLNRARDVRALWRDPDLLFAQACGYPLIADDTLALRVIAMPRYAPGSGSVLVARADDGRATLADYRGGRAALNDPRSNTGMNLFRATIAPVRDDGPFFDDRIETGSHRASVIAIVDGVADIAAIDRVTYAALARFEPALIAPLSIVGHSPPSPALPFVTAARTDAATVAALRAALAHAATHPGLAAAREALFLTDIAPADRGALAPIAALEAAAIAAGHGDL